METTTNNSIAFDSKKNRRLPFDLKLMLLIGMIGLVTLGLDYFKLINNNHGIIKTIITSFKVWDYAIIIVALSYILHQGKSLKSIQLTRGVFVLVFFIDILNVLIRWYLESTKTLLNTAHPEEFIPPEVLTLFILYLVLLLINFFQFLNEAAKVD